ncbi:MAG: hypothetical protein ACTSWJ_02385 [Candidatus Heimdallarchaeaceae archaeon]
MGSDKMMETIHDLTQKMKEGQQAFMGEAAFDVKLPFDLCWFDYLDSTLLENYVSEQLKGVPLKVGMLVGRVNPEVPKDHPEIISINPCFSYGPTKSWSLCGSVLYIKVGDFFNREELTEIYNACVPDSLDDPELINEHIESGLKSNFLMMPTIDFWTHDVDEHTKVWRDLGKLIGNHATATLNIFLMLVNCNNVITETVYKKKKGKRKSIPKGETYKVLKFKVKKTSKRYEYGEEEELKETVMPLHLCKGHFRVYTEERPLFGKIVCRIWVGTHLRGDPEKGILIKDYEAVI